MKCQNALYFITAATALIIAMMGIYQLLRTGLPSADVIAAHKMAHPIISVSDFEPGDARIITLNNLPIVVWRRNAEDMQLAASQSDPTKWHAKYTNVYGQNTPVFSDDENLTLNHEWFFALAVASPHKFVGLPYLRSGDFDGFFSGRYADHYDLSGRFRKGQSGENLTIVPARMADDQQSIQLDLSGIPDVHH